VIYPPLKCPACGAEIPRIRPFECAVCRGGFELTASEWHWYIPVGAGAALAAALLMGVHDLSYLVKSAVIGGCLLSYVVMAIHVTFWPPELGTKGNSILPSETFGTASRNREPQAGAPRGSAPPVVIPEGAGCAESFGYLLGRVVGWVRKL